MTSLFINQAEATTYVAADEQTNGLKVAALEPDEDFHPKALNILGGGKITSRKPQLLKPKESASDNNLAVSSTHTFSHTIEAKNQDRSHHPRGGRHRRSYSLKSKCFPSFKKVCKIFTVNGVTKPYCVHVKQSLCYALD